MQTENGKVAKLQIWDTAGQDRFRSITKNYYKGANGIIVIFSVTDKKSFDNVKKWIHQIKAEVNETVTIILVANKIDDEENREVTTEEGIELAESFGLKLFECSAKTGENINSTFNDLVNTIVQIKEKTSTKGEKLKQNKIGGGPKKTCCLDE